MNLCFLITTLHKYVHKWLNFIPITPKKSNQLEILRVHYINMHVYLFIWGFTSLSTLYRSYHDG